MPKSTDIPQRSTNDRILRHDPNVLAIPAPREDARLSKVLLLSPYPDKIRPAKTRYPRYSAGRTAPLFQNPAKSPLSDAQSKGNSFRLPRSVLPEKSVSTPLDFLLLAVA